SPARRPPRPSPFPYTTLFRSDRVPRPEPSQGRPDGERSDVIGPDHRHGAAGGAAGAGLEQVVDLVAERDPDGVDRGGPAGEAGRDRKSTRLNSSHVKISYAVF